MMFVAQFVAHKHTEAVNRVQHSVAQVSTLTTDDGQAMQHGSPSERMEATGQLFQSLFASWCVMVRVVMVRESHTEHRLQETVEWVQQHRADVLLLTQWLWLAGGAAIPALCNMPQLKVCHACCSRVLTALL